MSKIIVEVYLPAALQSYDIRIPTDMQLSQVTDLIAKALSQMSGFLYCADSSSLLCDCETGEILNINMSVWELGLKNGSRLMLI